ncbi:hypothetical protein [Encephalitozoon cuniculi GB-M1]|uniref:Uncharacterized protein n=2 Tax=Encephalitozoon cuniculi TaxID=6035 RepID=Q8SVB1_ENCCU|nr:uncharacterized protein ECU06_0810 [Encephalitozoon cuniculi GB-M1]AGE95770.1 hypothetical protein ECU06_0810 [Encephalitozoon cuniculi]KMV65975.1 hypothetical protein M970_060740 [Encephalitozoon cuniculi EcunIII-L]UYI27672.1 hypothetical protein J0A71_07g15510 [Encephalitozoon cuniculi]CAD25441.1 hypothetical protein [Encephalitozoon cuniculi GB-M1]
MTPETHGQEVGCSKLAEELKTLDMVVYKSRNGHRGSKVFRELVHLKRLCRSFLLKRTRSKRNEVLRMGEKLYILATSNIPDGYFVGYTLIVLGLCSRIHYLVSEAECIEDANDIDEMFAEIE